MHVQWAVRVASPGSDRADYHLDGALRDDAESTSPALDVHIVADKGEAWTLVRIFAGGRIRSFGPQPARFAQEAFLRRANNTWDDLESALPALAKKQTAARIEVRDVVADVWFAYVAKTVDLLFAAGFEEVRFPQEGLVLMRPTDGG